MQLGVRVTCNAWYAMICTCIYAQQSCRVTVRGGYDHQAESVRKCIGALQLVHASRDSFLEETVGKYPAVI